MLLASRQFEYQLNLILVVPVLRFHFLARRERAEKRDLLRFCVQLIAVYFSFSQERARHATRPAADENKKVVAKLVNWRAFARFPELR